MGEHDVIRDEVELREALRDALVASELLPAQAGSPSERLKQELVVDLFEEAVRKAAAFERQTKASEILELRRRVGELEGRLEAKEQALAEAEISERDIRERALDDQRRIGRLEDQLEQESSRRRDLEFSNRTEKVEHGVAAEGMAKQLQGRAAKHEQELRGTNRRLDNLVLLDRLRAATLILAMTGAAIVVPLYMNLVAGLAAFLVLTPLAILGLTGGVVALGGRAHLGRFVTGSAVLAVLAKGITVAIDYFFRTRGGR